MSEDTLFPPGRLAIAQSRCAQAGLDALLVTPGPDLRYLTGYEATPLERLTCLVLPREADPVLVVPELEAPAARAAPVGGWPVEVRTWQETEDPYTLVASLVPADAGRVGLDDRMWAAKAMGLRHAMPGVAQELAGPVLHPMRMHKTPAEIAELARAAEAIDRVHAQMSQWLRPGRTERQVGHDIAEAILAQGHVRVDFVIVGSGPNGASPHHELSDRVIAPGDPVVVDIGGTTLGGYASDCTRTYVAGAGAPAEFRALYRVLLQAQRAACELAGPGVTAEQVDAAARSVITQAGYGAFFVHRTGHGIGLETHEEPYIVAGSHRVLAPGMAFSVEPGIYLPGRYGARIEDILVVTGTGAERLNVRPRELAVLEA
ncbi:MAG: M24 family metallopeptidase [Actinomycetes bacterium]